MKKSKFYLSTLTVLIMTLLGVASAKAVTINSIVPQNNTSIQVEKDGTAYCTITFSSPTIITSAEGRFPRSSYECDYENIDGSNDYNAVWKVIFPESYVGDMIKQSENSIRATVGYRGQDGSSGSVFLLYDLVSDIPLGADFGVFTEAKANGFLDFFRVGNETGYMRANDYNIVLEDNTIRNYFEEITITGPDGFLANAVRYDYANNQTVYFEPAITKSGTYDIHFPFDAFTVGIPAQKPENDEAPSEGDNIYSSMEKDYTFSIIIEEAVFMDKAELISPVSSYISSLGRFEFSYIGETLHLVNPSTTEDEDGHILSSTPLTLSIQDEGSFEVYPYLIYDTPGDPNIDFGSEESVLSDSSANQLVVVNLYAVQEQFGQALPYGLYTLGIPAGVFANEEGALNPAQSFEVTLMKSSDWGEVTPPSMDNDWKLYDYYATDLSEVTVIWEEGTIEKTKGSENIVAYPESESVEQVNLLYGKEVVIDETKTGTPLIINLSELSAGYWNVSIPEGYVIISGDLINSQQTISYHIIDTNSSGLDTIPAENGIFKVYDLNGVNILTTTNLDALLNLPQGLYIINGRKTLIRKQ